MNRARQLILTKRGDQTRCIDIVLDDNDSRDLFESTVK